MSPVATEGPGPLPGPLRAYLGAPCLAPMWAAARAKLERGELKVSGTLTLTLDDAGADHLSGLLAAPVHRRPDGSIRLPLARLDQALRASRGSRGLLSVLAELSGRPLTDRRAAASAADAARADLLVSLEEQLDAAGLGGAGWAGPWLAGVRATGQLIRAGARAGVATARAVAVLGTLAGVQPLADTDMSALRAGAPVPATFELAELATICCGGAHGLDPGEAATALVLRALAAAYGQTVPASAAGRRALWLTAGVAPDAVSGTVLLWGLRPPGPGRWAAMMGARADQGLVTHVTLQEWRAAAAAEPWAAAGQVVFACENPQVLQAAARAGTPGALCCTSGNPAAVALAALDALVAAGVIVRYHGDFDVEGVAIAGRLFARGVQPWRFGADDYTRAVATSGGQSALTLTGEVGSTPWDARLRTEMNACRVAVHEEALLSVLLGDL